MSKNTNNFHRQDWEQSEFPILCQTCLGDNPYLRMTKETYGKECKVCARPFTVFRWCPGKGMRHKKTEVCQICARLKNVCQTCLLDLEYGLPTQVRDAALGIGNPTMTSDVNKEYYTQAMAKTFDADPSKPHEPFGVDGKAHDMLLKLQRKAPYYKRNLPHICSFFVKGTCSRGSECPYRHEQPRDADDPLAKQNLKDRYHGVNDPVAEKMFKKYSNSSNSLEPPSDASITTLYLGGIDDQLLSKEDLKDHFYQFGEIQSLTLAVKHKAAFVTFVSRDAAERAAQSCKTGLVIKGQTIRVLWGRSAGSKGASSEDKSSSSSSSLPPVPGLPAPPPLPPSYDQSYYPPPPPHHAPGFPSFPSAPTLYPPPPSGPPPGFAPVHYPSMDPNRRGAGKTQVPSEH